MHLPDGPQLDLSTQVAKVKAKTRPWKAIIALILAICAAAASRWAHNSFHRFLGPLGQSRTRSWPSDSRWRSARSPAWPPSTSSGKAQIGARAGHRASHAAIVRYALLLIGAVTTLIVTLGAARHPDRPACPRRGADQRLRRHRGSAVAVQRVRGHGADARPPVPGRGRDPAAGRGARRPGQRDHHRDRHHLRAPRPPAPASSPSRTPRCSTPSSARSPSRPGPDPQTPPPLMALPAVQPAPPPPPPMAARIVTHAQVPDSQPSDTPPADSHPEVPTGTPEPRPSGTPT